MARIFTAYNCGTGHNRWSNDVVAQLWRETIKKRYPFTIITDGPGSGGEIGLAPGVLSKISAKLAQAGGIGVDDNVAYVVKAAQDAFSLDSNMVINMCGWSRGAVTCVKIANALQADPQTRNIPIYIFAIDPVPGGSCINNHMWHSIDMTPNIRMCNLILSQHDRRRLFAPYYPPVLGPETDVDIMPGDHSAVVKPQIVEGKPSLSAACELVKDMAKRFLILKGTTFNPQDLLSPPEVLKRYGLIAERFDDYAQFPTGVLKDWRKRLQGGRKVFWRYRNQANDEAHQPREHGHHDQDQDDQWHTGRILPEKPRFFLNYHHRTVFQPLFPLLTNEIDLPPERAFSDETSSHWMRELYAMHDAGMTEQSKMVITYATACQEKRATAAAA